MKNFDYIIGNRTRNLPSCMVKKRNNKNSFDCTRSTVSWNRWFVAGHVLRRTVFDFVSFHVRIVVDTVKKGKGFFSHSIEYYRFQYYSENPPHLFIYPPQINKLSEKGKGFFLTVLNTIHFSIIPKMLLTYLFILHK
jgi:hypothetical protein